MEKPQKAPRSHQSTRPTNKKQLIWFTIFVLAWTALSMIGSQYIVAWPMLMLLGDQVNQPFGMAIYYVLSYLLTLALVILIPPRLFQLWCRQHSSQQPAKSTPIEQAKLTDSTNAFSTTPTEMGVKAPPTLVDIGLAPIGYVVYTVISSALLQFMSIFNWFNADQSQDVGFGYFITGPERIIAMISIVFIAPLAEELIMRGWLYGKLRSRLPIWLAILLTSILFGLLHGQLNVGVGVFVLSVVLCLLREITGSVWSGILLHMLSNGIAFYLLFVVHI